jgi:hypothetical protein
MSDTQMTLHSDARKLNWSMVGVIVVLALNTATMFFWTGGLSQRVANLERLVVPLADGTLARLDERTKAMKEQLDRIERGEQR